MTTLYFIDLMRIIIFCHVCVFWLKNNFNKFVLKKNLHKDLSMSDTCRRKCLHPSMLFI